MDASSWSEERVSEYLSSCGLGIKPEVIAQLQDEEVDGTALLLLTREDLVAKGFKLGSITKLMKAVELLRTSSTSSAAPEAFSAMQQMVPEPSTAEMAASAPESAPPPEAVPAEAVSPELSTLDATPKELSTAASEASPPKEAPEASVAESGAPAEAAPALPDASAPEAAPAESSPATRQELLEMASTHKLPCWWLAEPDAGSVAAVPILEAVQTLVSDSISALYGVRLSQDLLKMLVMGPAPMKPPTSHTKLNELLSKGNKPLTAAAKELGAAFEAKGVEQVAQAVAADVKSKTGDWLQRCEVRTVMSKKGSAHFLLVQVSELGWAHELRRQSHADRLAVSKLDPVQRKNLEALLKRLQEVMDSCVLSPLRKMVREGMKAVQEQIGLTHDQGGYKQAVEARFRGKKKDGSKCFWEHLNSPECVSRLEFAESYEYTASMYINFANYAGRPIEFWDWSALCSCAESCDIFKMTLKQAMAQGLCKPSLEGLEPKQKNKLLSTPLVEVTRSVREIRNPMQHYNILDMEFPKKFEQVLMACAALGGDLKLAKQMVEASRLMFPAKNTLEELKQYERAMEEGGLKMLTADQGAKLQFMLDQIPGCRLKFQAAAGTGKTLLIIKYAIEWLYRMRNNEKDMPGSEFPPLLILVHSRGLQSSHTKELMRELGAGSSMYTSEHQGLGAVQLEGCTARVVVSTIDAVWGYTGRQFGTVLVDEAHEVFGYQPAGYLEGQHVHKDPSNVWVELEKLCASGGCRVFMFHDESYQRVGVKPPAWPDGCEEHVDFLAHSVRMTGAARDLSTKFSRENETKSSQEQMHFQPLLDERVKGPEPSLWHVQETTTSLGTDAEEYISLVLEGNFFAIESAEVTKRYSQELAKCVSELLDAQGLAAHQLAVLMPGTLLRPDSEGQSVAQELHTATLGLLKGKAKSAVTETQIGEVDLERMYWGAAESFAGLERAAVVLVGFQHPVHLRQKHQAGQLKSTVDPVMYLAVTRCTYKVAVVDIKLDEWLAHYQIRHAEESKVPHSSGTHSAVMDMCGESRLELECTVDLGSELPEGLESKTMVTLQGVTRERWDGLQVESVGQMMPGLQKLTVEMGQDSKLDWACALQYMDAEERSKHEHISRSMDMKAVLADAKAWTAALVQSMQIQSVNTLKELNLSRNQLASVPGELGQLRSLQTLYLHENQLTSVPGELGQLRSLQTLRLSQNQLASVPGELGQLRSLQTLNLHQNQLASVPGELGQLRSLQHLGLQENQALSHVSEQAMHSLASSLEALVIDAEQHREFSRCWAPFSPSVLKVSPATYSTNSTKRRLQRARAAKQEQREAAAAAPSEADVQAAAEAAAALLAEEEAESGAKPSKKAGKQAKQSKSKSKKKKR